MGRNVAIGIQSYNEIIEKNYFYVDKTAFIKEWWDSGDSVTLITRPRRFGKTHDVMLEPVSAEDDAIIIEFKVFNARREKTLEETVENALRQIQEKAYERSLLAKEIPAERIRKYGFAFEGKTVLIG